MQGGFYCKNEAVVDNTAQTVCDLIFSFVLSVLEEFLKNADVLVFCSASYPCTLV